jgi:AcrR family transcriptional regulator
MSPTRKAPLDQRASDGAAAGRNGAGHEHPIGHERVTEIQRARMLAAMVEVTAEHGAGNVTVAHVVERAGVSRRTFYELFDDREDCFLAAFDEAIQQLSAVVVPAYDAPAKWREQIRAGLTALLELIGYDRGMGRLVIVETLGAGPRALERRRRVLAQVIAAVDRGRGETRRGEDPPPLTAEGVVGAVLSVLHSRLVTDRGACPKTLGACLPVSPPIWGARPDLGGSSRVGPAEEEPTRLVALANELMSMIVLPYLGPAAARRELQRTIPSTDVRARKPKNDPLRELEMRLTYRTVRVLTAVAELGGRGSYPSNREIAQAAGVSDQGQMSKLLARLDHLGLIDNRGAGQARGGPNAWALTDTGREVHCVIAAQAGPS